MRRTKEGRRVEKGIDEEPEGASLRIQGWRGTDPGGRGPRGSTRNHPRSTSMGKKDIETGWGPFRKEARPEICSFRTVGRIEEESGSEVGPTIRTDRFSHALATCPCSHPEVNGLIWNTRRTRVMVEKGRGGGRTRNGTARRRNLRSSPPNAGARLDVLRFTWPRSKFPSHRTFLLWDGVRIRSLVIDATPMALGRAPARSPTIRT